MVSSKPIEIWYFKNGGACGRMLEESLGRGVAQTSIRIPCPRALPAGMGDNTWIITVGAIIGLGLGSRCSEIKRYLY
jgi:hypothetical protein